MNTNALARNYEKLTAQERFPLIVAASARRDQAELDRLARGGARIKLSIQAHARLCS